MANVIKAVFGGGRFATTAPVFQWNYGDKLQFIGINLPANYEVHFANALTGSSVTALGDEDGVEIPASVFQPGAEIYAWVFLTEEGAGWTKYQAKIPIYKRAQPTNETPTPAQQSALDSAIALLNEAAEDLSEAEQGIPTAIDTALQEAKDSGEFDGQDGYSPTVTVTEITGGHEVTITDTEGDHVFDVMDGTGGGGGGAVSSVNGQTGAVVLDASDVGALPDDTTYVSSVNGSSGAVTVTVPTKTSDLQNDSGFITSAPVTSVNSKTGAVTLTASDVGAGTYSKPGTGIPKTDLESAVQTSLDKADTALQSAPVTSVNSQTGAVSLSIPSSASDVGAVAANQGVANAGKFLIVANDGTVTPITVPSAQGVSF